MQLQGMEISHALTGKYIQIHACFRKFFLNAFLYATTWHFHILC